MNWVLRSPLKVAQSSKKDFILNLNNYRNAHYQSLSKTKINYKNDMMPQIKKLPNFTKIKITYVLYPKTKRLCDVPNVCAVHDKYFQDALVEGGKIQDDNYLFVPEVTYAFGKVEPDNPRVEIHISEI